MWDRGYLCGSGPTWPYPGGEYLQNLDWLISRMHKLSNDMQEIQTYFEEFKEQVSEIVAEQLEVALKPMQDSLAEMESKLNQMEIDLTLFHAQLTSLSATHEKDVRELWDKINSLEFNLPDVFNPVADKMDTLQNTLNDLYFNTYDTWISPKQFDALNVTPNAFDALNITPRDFDRRAREILGGN